MGVVAFGRDAAIEVPPFDDDVQMSLVGEVLLDPNYTNLAGAVKLAEASFPEDAAKRVVLVSDGNQNLGSVVQQAESAAGAGIGIDVLPVRYHTRSEIVVERLAVPSDVRRDQPFDLKVVVSNTGEATAGGSGEVTGRLVVSQLAGGRAQVLSDEAVTLPPGKRVFTIRQQIESSNFYTYEARFVPDRPEDDAMPQNNRATAFTQVRGKGQVLLIRDYEYPADRPPEHAALIAGLRRQGLEVTERTSDQPFASLAELQPFDTVLLANVPREHFTDRQIEMLVRNTQQMGAGLVMLGGPNSLGAGGWAITELEKAMPVDFQIKSAKVVPRGALVMLMHACEIPEGNHWQKVVAHEAIKALGARDYCGVLYWGGAGDQWLWSKGLVAVGGNRNQMMAAVDRMTPGDMPDFDPSLRMAVAGYRKIPDAAVRHMIVISDGDPTAPTGGAIQALKDLNVTISTVAIGAHGPAESGLLRQIAADTGGKYYQVNNPKALPRIFQREARRVARPLIWDKYPIRPQQRFPHEMLSGVENLMLPVDAFVMTTKKENPLVEVSLVAPVPGAEQNSTVLASWTYGLGKAAVFASDTGALWTSKWTGQPLYDKLFGQIVRWSMRPTNESGKFSVAAEPGDGKVDLVVTALDENDEFYNFLSMTGTAVGPDLQPTPVRIDQTAPGRYVGSFSARDAGSYFVMISPGAGMAPIRTGINVPYSAEFRDRSANEALLGELAKLTPKGGKPGLVIAPLDRGKPTEAMLAANPFRHGELAKATSSQDIWHFLVFVCGCLFFFDVFFRRVQVSLTWLPPLAGRAWNFILRRQSEPVPVETMQRLRSSKAQVTGQIDQLRADARFEPSPEASTDVSSLEEAPSKLQPPKPPTMTDEEKQKAEEESYTERLLRAKKQVWKDKEQE